MVKFFLDTEFTNMTEQSDLLSIALVDERGDAFYGISSEVDFKSTTPFVRENVLPILERIPRWDDMGQLTMMRGEVSDIAIAMRNWLDQRAYQVQIWSDVLYFDWWQMGKIFGGITHILPCVHYIPMELSTLLWVQDLDPDVDRQSLLSTETLPAAYTPHNALSDAYVGMLILKRFVP